MEFDRRNREALVNTLNEANKKLDSMKKLINGGGQERLKKELCQMVLINVQEATIKIIERSLTNNHPFDFELEDALNKL